MTDQLEAWRENREPGWFHDVGYVLQDVLRAHRYEYRLKGGRPDDPGWHECSCGWEGYWVEFHPHVTDHLRAVVTPQSLPCCNYREDLDRPCDGTAWLHPGKPTYVCDACGARCGRLVHPSCQPEEGA